MAKYLVEVDVPKDTLDECAYGELCQFLLGGFCTLFQDTVVQYKGHTYKLRQCPASGEKRYDEK